MTEYYTRKEAMKRLGMLSTNAFIHLSRKHPGSFIAVEVKTPKHKPQHTMYEKDPLERFAISWELLKKETLR